MSYVDSKIIYKICRILVCVLVIMTLSGCLDLIDFNMNDTLYEAHPTKVGYTINYGYEIYCNGTGIYNIKYDCDLPEILYGSISTDLLNKENYEKTILANNSIVRWNISDENSNYYKIGVSANILAQSYIVSDLNGEKALSLREIKLIYPDLVDKFCHEQTYNDINYIDPENPIIKELAQKILNQTDSNNSFKLAMEAFIWLKKNTHYISHQINNNPQPAFKTCQAGSGDCDDLSFLYISICRSIGIPSRFINGCLIDEVNGNINATGHAWAEVFVGTSITEDGWIPVECAGSASIKTEVNQNFGIEDVGHIRLFEDDGSNMSLNISLSGLRISHSEDIKIDVVSFVEIDNYVVYESRELIVDKYGNRYYNDDIKL